MRQTLTTIIGKSVRKMAQARGGGSALPGLFAERIDPDFVKRTLANLPYGIVLVSGTNGKTTTTKMVVKLLESQGLKVFTNRTGSNFTRGVAAALLGDVNLKGELSADIAVLELDEAHAVHFVRTIPPTYCLLLNVMRDQLDRFGEIDKTAALLHTIATATTTGVVVNRNDPRLSSEKFIRGITCKVASFSVAPKLQHLFPSDDAMRGAIGNPDRTAIDGEDTRLERIDGQRASIKLAGADHEVDLKLKGIYNIQNAVAAVALVRMIMGDHLSIKHMLTSLANVTPAFGRGETLVVRGYPCELVLVKNPSGFRLSLKSFNATGYATMIAINDNYADGRDMSWLWDVNFDSLVVEGVAMLTGIRAYDMALRMQYEEVEVGAVEPNLKNSLEQFIAENNKPKRIYCTYTAMLALRRELGKYTKMESMQ